MNEILLECRDLSKNYAGIIALDNVNIQIGRGKIIGLLGPNGSGKTTLIKIINGLLKPRKGKVLIDGKKPGIYTKSIISYLPDRMYFAEWMKVGDVIDFFEDFYEDFDRARAEDMCGRLGISMKQKVKSLSKGNKEKVQLIMVMSRDAQLYILDEPIAGVDPAARDYILETIIKNYNEEASVIISTHLISDVERILDEAIFISNGKILKHEIVDDLRESTGKTLDEIFREEFRAGAYYAYPPQGYPQQPVYPQQEAQQPVEEQGNVQIGAENSVAAEYKAEATEGAADVGDNSGEYADGVNDEIIGGEK